MAKKSIIDEAKDMLSSWKNEIEEKDGHILVRKKLREKDDEELFEEIKKQFHEVSEDINEKGKKAIEITVKEFFEFTEAVKKGTADIYQKLEIEKKLKQLDDFFNKIQSKGSDSFKNISKIMKEKIDAYDKELDSEVEKVDDKKKEQTKTDNDISTLIKLAQEEYELKNRIK